jgi:ParB family chromosome partitioning protein
MEKIYDKNEVVDITLLKPNEYNPKLDYNSMDTLKAEFQRIKKSVEEHGQIDPIIVRELETGQFEIIDGYHRWNAMKDLGYDKCEIKNLGKLDLNDAISKTLSLEKTSIVIDPLMESELIKRYIESQGAVGKLPYTDLEISEKMAMLSFDWENYQGRPETGAPEGEEPVEVECPQCHHRFIPPSSN